MSMVFVMCVQHVWNAQIIGHVTETCRLKVKLSWHSFLYPNGTTMAMSWYNHSDHFIAIGIQWLSLFAQVLSIPVLQAVELTPNYEIKRHKFNHINKCIFCSSTQHVWYKKVHLVVCQINALQAVTIAVTILTNCTEIIPPRWTNIKQ